MEAQQVNDYRSRSRSWWWIAAKVGTDWCIVIFLTILASGWLAGRGQFFSLAAWLTIAVGVIAAGLILVAHTRTYVLVTVDRLVVQNIIHRHEIPLRHVVGLRTGTFGVSSEPPLIVDAVVEGEMRALRISALPGRRRAEFAVAISTAQTAVSPASQSAATMPSDGPATVVEKNPLQNWPESFKGRQQLLNRRLGRLAEQTQAVQFEATTLRLTTWRRNGREVEFIDQPAHGWRAHFDDGSVAELAVVRDPERELQALSAPGGTAQVLFLRFSAGEAQGMTFVDLNRRGGEELMLEIADSVARQGYRLEYAAGRRVRRPRSHPLPTSPEQMSPRRVILLDPAGRTLVRLDLHPPSIGH